MKAKSGWKTVALACALALLAVMAALLWQLAHRETPQDARWRYAAGDILCVGDSLTSGTCFGHGLEGADIQQRYSYYLARMLNARVDTAAVPGISVSAWFTEYAARYDYRDYDTVILWFGTNNGPANSLEADVLSRSGPDAYAETETGYYCRLIEKIRAENPDCLIVLVNVFASKDDVEEVNRGISSIAAHYALPLVDMSDMGSEAHPEYHAGLQNPHFGKTGNIAVASRIVDTLEIWFAADPSRAEYGVRALAE
ncbi:MAG: SGNH/GDSL hydrolase family protein [Oscillospiraceae bacterium]|nr:SGNH/GDSL hydrolase family protein [Oscillospiraceae bacterium]